MTKELEFKIERDIWKGMSKRKDLYTEENKEILEILMPAIIECFGRGWQSVNIPLMRDNKPYELTIVNCY